MNTEQLTSGGVKKSVVEHVYYNLIRKSGQKKLKLFPCLSHERGSRCTSPLILKYSARCWRMVNITLRPLSSPRNDPGSYWIGEDTELFIQKYTLLCDLKFVPPGQSLQGAGRLGRNCSVSDLRFHHCFTLNPLMPNDPYMGPTAPLTSRCCILYIYSTNIRTEYFKHAA
jgi:hypothetical protein